MTPAFARISVLELFVFSIIKPMMMVTTISPMLAKKYIKLLGTLFEAMSDILLHEIARGVKVNFFGSIL